MRRKERELKKKLDAAEEERDMQNQMKKERSMLTERETRKIMDFQK